MKLYREVEETTGELMVIKIGSYSSKKKQIIGAYVEPIDVTDDQLSDAWGTVYQIVCPKCGRDKMPIRGIDTSGTEGCGTCRDIDNVLEIITKLSE